MPTFLVFGKNVNYINIQAVIIYRELSILTLAIKLTL
jgi:hypothetical protein